MYNNKSEKGQALVIIALAAVGLFAFTALAIDGSRVFSDRRHAQNAADTAALAAALAKIRTPNYPPNAPNAPDLAAIAAGEDRAESNGYITDADSNVQVHICNETGLVPPCEGLPVGADLSEYIQVVIRLTTKTTFARIIGRTEVPSIVTAVARAKPGSFTPPVDGMALAAMSEHDPDALIGHGNVSLDVIGGGVFVNSDAAGCPGGAMGVVGNGSYTAPAFELVGGPGALCQSGQPAIDESLVHQTGHIPPFADIEPPDITCEPTSGLNGNTFIPGTYGNIDIPGGTYNFADGNYCFTGGVNVHGNTNLIVNNANFLISSGEFVSNANGTFTCTNLLVHINGGTGMRFNGSTEIDCAGVTFFATTGTVTWNGGVANTLSAPSTGDYANLLIYMPSTNSSALSINGNAENSLTGSIIAVASPITIEGNTGTVAGTFQLSSQIIGHTVDIGGNGAVTINYDPGALFSLSDPHAISLTE
jgi:hypothetical protein